MIDQIRAELLKIHSTRTTLGLLIAMVLLVFLLGLLTGLLTGVDDLHRAADQQDLFGVGRLATIFAALAGILVVTSEYRFGTIRPTFVFTPRRSRVIGAKLAASLAAGAALAVVAIVLSCAIGAAVLAGRGIPLALDRSDRALIVLGGLAASALWGAVGAGFASLLHNQVAAVIGLLVWVFVLESLVFGLVPSVGRFMPTQAGDGLMGVTTDHLLSAAAGGAVLVAWAAALAAAGIAVTARRDVD
jgi:hypothetical protein